MAHPAYWPTKSFFYPVGNTPPICLTQNLPREVDASILLLGCGDPRNILYTLYSQLSDDARKYDITCCDMEPAVLARNILLFTLIADDGYLKTTAQIWNIFFHFFLDEASNALLLAQSRKLATLSVDMQTWHSSEYSTFLRISSRLTLSEVNRLWTLYAATGTFSVAQEKRFKTKFVTEMKAIAAGYKDKSVISGARSAGPLYLQIASLCAAAHSRYWETGVTFEAQTDVASASIVNATFAYTAENEGFLPHYGTCPILAFPLATAVAPVHRSNAQGPCQTIFDLFGAIKTQFFDWCTRFRDLHHNLIIRSLAGDAIATCHTLLAYADNNSLTAHERLNPWSLAWLSLNGDYAENTEYPPPSRFNVIDTSNLADHVGLLNVIVSAALLLARDPVSSLFTETLLSRGEDPFKSFTQRLCCDPSTLFVLLDLVPSGYVSGYITQSNVHEVVGSAASAYQRSAQYHERSVWKILSLANNDGLALHSLSFDAVKLSALLLHTYLQMFSHEDVASMYRTASLIDLQDRSGVHYSRHTFTFFLKVLKSRISTDWKSAIKCFLDRVGSNNQLLVGMNYYQDLLSHLHMLGLYTDGSWVSMGVTLPGSEPFRHWQAVPTMVCLVILVPRGRLHAIDNPHTKATSPLLHVQLLTNMHSNSFTSLDITFGTISIEGEGENAQITVTEDARGKRGNSSVVVAVWIPAWLIASNPSGTAVTLNVVSTPLHIQQLSSELGLTLQLYSVPLMDSTKVHIVKNAPVIAADVDCQSQAHHPSSVLSLEEPSTQLSPSADTIVSLDTPCRRIVSLTRRIDFSEANIQAALSNPNTHVAVSPIGGADVDLTIGTVLKQRIHFPPVADNSKAKLRIARKSSWIEVVLPIGEAKAYALQTYPLVPRFGSVSSWNVHYVNLERLPALRLDDPNQLKWLTLHVLLAFSDAETAQRFSGTPFLTAFSQVKDSIHCMVSQYTETYTSVWREVFALNSKSQGGIDTLVFVTHLRLDLPAHTILLDAYIWPLDENDSDDLRDAFETLMSSGVMAVFVSAEELVVWKRLLPALTERCRTWTHKKECAYIRRGEIPLSIEHRKTPICGCGQGIVTDEFKAHKDWAPFTPYVTRVAISPLFALSYLDSVGTSFKDFVKKSTASMADASQQERHPQCAKCGGKPPQVKLSACSVCKSVQYCGRQCQVADWKRHKAACRKV